MALPIRVGVIGCGLIAQTMHIRALADLPEFVVTAACDSDPLVVEAVGRRFSIPLTTTDPKELVQSTDVDAVLIATPDHFAPAMAAMESRKHLLVEKPLAWSPAQGATLVDAQREAQVVGLVGYMRRYDSAYEAMQAQLAGLGRIRMTRIHDFACRFDKDRDLYQLALTSNAKGTTQGDYQQNEVRLASELGLGDATQIYFLLLMLASHDLSMARGLLGDPVEVVSAHAFDDASVLVTLGYADSGPCVLEVSAAASYEWYDGELAVFGDHSSVALRLANPFVQYGQSSMTARGGGIDGFEERSFTGSHADAFRREWQHFGRCIAAGEPPRTPLVEGFADLELAVEIVRRIKG